MKKQIEVILVGVGGRGGWAVRQMKQDARFRAVALVDAVQQNLKTAAETLEMDAQQCFDSLEEACKQVKADAAIICTPMLTHEELCLIAFQYGLDVLVEKGMATDWEQACRMVAAAEAKGVRFCVAQNYRYRRDMAAMRSILLDPSHPQYPGEIGMADCMQHRFRPDPRTSTYPYAMVWDMGCHHYDYLISIFGSLDWVEAKVYAMPWSKYPHPSNITATMRFANGVVCNYLLTHDALFSNMRWVFQGERGVLRLGDDVEGLVAYDRPEQAFRTGNATACELGPESVDVVGVLNDFYTWIDGGAEPGISGRNNLETMAACCLMVQAAETGERVYRSALKETAS